MTTMKETTALMGALAKTRPPHSAPEGERELWRAIAHAIIDASVPIAQYPIVRSYFHDVDLT